MLNDSKASYLCIGGGRMPRSGHAAAPTTLLSSPYPATSSRVELLLLLAGRSNVTWI